MFPRPIARRDREKPRAVDHNCPAAIDLTIISWQIFVETSNNWNSAAFVFSVDCFTVVWHYIRARGKNRKIIFSWFEMIEGGRGGLILCLLQAFTKWDSDWEKTAIIKKRFSCTCSLPPTESLAQARGIQILHHNLNLPKSHRLP